MNYLFFNLNVCGNIQEMRLHTLVCVFALCVCVYLVGDDKS